MRERNQILGACSRHVWLIAGKGAHHGGMGVGGQAAVDETHVQQDHVEGGVDGIVKEFDKISMCCWYMIICHMA